MTPTCLCLERPGPLGSWGEQGVRRKEAGNHSWNLDFQGTSSSPSAPHKRKRLQEAVAPSETQCPAKPQPLNSIMRVRARELAREQRLLW